MTTQVIQSRPAFPVVEASGTAYEMGRQHGEQAAELVSRYLVWIEKMTRKSRDALCRNAMQFEPLIRNLSQTFLEEVRGLADGAGISYEEAMLCQARSEASRAFDGACTAFAIKGEATADGSTLVGQNQDLAAEFSDVAIVLKVKPGDGRPRAVMFTFAGQLGYSGMNQHGVAHFANALYDFEWRPGIAHYPLKRVMLEKRTAGECIELLRNHRTCSAANTVMADGQGNITSVEIRPEGIALYNGAHPDAILHTNHYVSEDFARFETNTRLADTCPRLERVSALIREQWGSITVDTMKEILADHEGDPAAICRHGADRMHSISGYIAEPMKGLFHVRRGHGCIGTWTTYEV
ncbi:MAG: C45 family peptidase [Chloroflexi bacterium]|nr:C45 family peptidase [Chloroflexota bacterium]